MLSNFPVVKLRFHFSPVKPMRWPAFDGSTLRGAWGHSLRGQVCLMRGEECPRCPERESCDFTHLFRTLEQRGFKTPPQPFVIEPAVVPSGYLGAGQPCHFDFMLIGQAISRLHLVVDSWRAALANGIGHQRVPCRLVSVSLPDEQDRALFSASEGWFSPPCTTIDIPDQGEVSEARLIFHSPLRLRLDNDLRGAGEITPEDMLLSLIRRVNLLAGFHCGVQLPLIMSEWRELARSVRGEMDVHWQDKTRYSTVQEQSMSFGGLLGEWRLSGPLGAFMPFLYIGQWLHVGKNATFGLGGYRIVGQ